MKDIEEVFRSTLISQKQSWLRSEIEKLNDVSRDWIAEATHNSDNFEVRIKLDVLDDIITRYKEELKVLESNV